MKDPRLLASVALFRELYDNNKDIYDVISEFIRATVLLNSKWSFNATECTQDLQEHFGFQIPVAVVKTCLRNRLTKTGEFTLDNGIYLATDKFDRGKSIQAEFDSTKGEYDEILQSLVEHVKSSSVSFVDEEKLKSAFNAYLIDEKVFNEYVEYISHFLIKNQSVEGFRHKLNRIEEGLVLYAGIRYSSDPSKLGNWNSDITIFLDTEHLFSATGLNGLLHKQVFDDFNSLVKEVNSNNRKRGSITLRYFSEVGSDVDNFFYAAEKIIENKTQVDPSKTAMMFIINGCVTKSDIVSKKALFLSELNSLRISIEENDNYYIKTEYNVESQSLINNLKKSFNHNNENSRYADILKKFTKINALREGESGLGIERVSAIFMTENGLTQAVAFSKLVRSSESAIPFATNIEFMTERLWFKLNKGFSNNKQLPVSFDIITKAKLVLSSQLNNVVSERFNDLKVKHSKGEISDEEAALLISQLRGKPSKPEDFTLESLDESIDFINDNFIENTLREKTLLEKKSKDGEEAIKKLKKLKKLKYKRKVEFNKIYKKITLMIFCSMQLFAFVFIPCFLIFTLFLIYSNHDTILSIVFGFSSLIAWISSFIKVKRINGFFWGASKLFYKKHLRRKKALDI